jgi:TetR/AcrR family transcriptional repressor of nem operon
VKAVLDKVLGHFPWPSRRDARGDAVRMLCTITGAIALARAVDDEALSDEILREALAGFAAR